MVVDAFIMEEMFDVFVCKVDCIDELVMISDEFLWWVIVVL